jgi:hypothetical protein
MKYLIAVALFVALLTVPAANAQSKRIALTERSDVPLSIVASGMDKKCSNITLTMDTTKADYLLEALARGIHPNGRQYGAEYTLLSPSGDVLFHTTTSDPKNAMKDVCKFIGNAK